MITLMNHRETQYHAQKLWEVENIDVDQVVQSMFEQWSIQPQREAAQNLMQWLADTGKGVFQEDLILDYGLDCLRLYLLFEKTPKADDPYLDTWEECSLEGLYKFLGKFRRLILATNEWNQQGGYHDQNVEELLEMTSQMKSDMLMHFAKGNTMPNRHNAMSVLMTGIGNIQKALDTGAVLQKMHSHDLELLEMMAPFAPHLSEELWQTLQQPDKSVFMMPWQCEQLSQRMITIPVQVNSRTRRTIQVDMQISEEECLQLAKKAVEKYLDAESTYRCIFVPGKIINYVKNSEH